MLTKNQVREIRSLAKKVTMRKLAKKYGVHHTAIFKVIHRRTKAHVKDKPCPTCGE